MTSLADAATPPIRNEACERLEEAGYLGPAAEAIYYVLHPSVDRPRGLVLLAGPFASERPHRYHAWTAWARYLATCGFTALRFDYRGVGESLGRFEDMGLGSWLEDIGTCARSLTAREPGAPLVLHGLGLGALLASRAFEAGLGDALLQWLPPRTGQEMLYDQLRLRLSHDLSLGVSERRTRDDYLAEIEAGGSVEVEGYPWTRRLWSGAAGFEPGDATVRPASSTRPRHVATLDRLTAHFFGGVGPNPVRVPKNGIAMRLLNPDLSGPFAENAEWIRSATAGLAGRGP